MFNLFRTANQRYEDQAKEVYDLPAPKNTPSMPEVAQPKDTSKQEFYRIGARPDGMTTITLLDSGGFSMTLTLNQVACEQMIRMIRATYTEVTNDE